MVAAKTLARASRTADASGIAVRSRSTVAHSAWHSSALVRSDSATAVQAEARVLTRSARALIGGASAAAEGATAAWPAMSPSAEASSAALVLAMVIAGSWR